MRWLVAAALVVFCGAAQSGPLETGAELPAVNIDSAIIASVDGPLDVVTVNAPANFAQRLAVTDLHDMLGRIDDMGTAGADPDLLIVFAGDWDTAIDFAAAIQIPDLADRYTAAAARNHVIDYSMRQLPEGLLHIYVIAQDLTPFPVPADCWARLLVGSVYVGGYPTPFTLRHCAASLGVPVLTD